MRMGTTDRLIFPHRTSVPVGADARHDCSRSRLDGGMHFTASVPAAEALCEGIGDLEGRRPKMNVPANPRGLTSPTIGPRPCPRSSRAVADAQTCQSSVQGAGAGPDLHRAGLYPERHASPAASHRPERDLLPGQHGRAKSARTSPAVGRERAPSASHFHTTMFIFRLWHLT